MSMLVSPADTPIAHQTERHLTVYLRDLMTKQPVAEADRWLYSVWQDQPDWTCLQRLVSGDDRLAAVTTIPVLMGCLQNYRQGERTAEQEVILMKQQMLTYQRLIYQFDQRKTSLLTGVSASLHYYMLVDRSPDSSHSLRQSLLMEQLRQRTVSTETITDLSLGMGYTGWMLTFIAVWKHLQSEQRIAPTVSSVTHAVTQYIEYLLAHQLPIDMDLETYSFFPTSIHQAEWVTTDIVSWATGDIGQLLLLYEAGKLLQRPDVVELADRLSGYLVQRRLLNRIRNDELGLINGIAGLSLMYRRLFLVTNRTDFLREGYYWLDQLLRRVQDGDYGPDQSVESGTLGIYGAIRQWLGIDTGLDLLFL